MCQDLVGSSILIFGFLPVINSRTKLEQVGLEEEHYQFLDRLVVLLGVGTLVELDLVGLLDFLL
jgi:hypothetical protein